jgi:hypothetical protein
MTSSSVHRDERTLVIENASYRWAFHVYSYGLLVLAGYRSLARDEAVWDLFALLVLGGVVASLYQWTHDVLTKRSAITIGMGMAVGALVAAAIAAAALWLR